MSIMRSNLQSEDITIARKSIGPLPSCVNSFFHSFRTDITCACPLSPIGYVAHLRFPSGGQTLIGSRAQKRVLDMWAYLGVFGIIQWTTFVCLLLTAALGCNSIDILMAPKFSPRPVPSHVCSIETWLNFKYFCTLVVPELVPELVPESVPYLHPRF